MALTIFLFSWTTDSSFDVKTVETHALHIYLVISEATVYQLQFWTFLKQKMKLSKLSHFQNRKKVKLRPSVFFSCTVMQSYDENFVPLHIFQPMKGQLILEWLFGAINFPKNQPKNMKDFCTRIYKWSNQKDKDNLLC